MSSIRLTILGEAASKGNRRQVVKFGDRTALIKSPEALAYERSALRQIPPVCRVRLSGPVRVTMRVFYASERPDLDASVILDCLQDRYAKDKRTGERELVQKGVYQNDRQVRELHLFHAIDRANPRAEIEIEPLMPQQVPMPLPKPELEGVPF